MTNLKINSTSTPYWCVVVPVDARLSITPYALLYKSGVYPAVRSVLPFPNMELLGCITSSGMDEEILEIIESWDTATGGDDYQDYYKNYGILNDEDYEFAFHFTDPHPSALSLLQHNQITLTADQKAVVVKQIT